MAKNSVVIMNHANLVKQVIFPIEVLPVKGVLASLMTQGIFLVLLLALYHRQRMALYPGHVFSYRCSCCCRPWR